MVNYDIKRLQQTQLEMLKDVHKICVENDIKYFLFYGSLLGAIRHKGFIPWDDDIDIVMMHEDYEKFLEVCKNKLPNKYFLQNTKTDENFPRMWSKVRINNTCNMEREYRRLKVHYGIDMDIFELIYLSNNYLIRKVQTVAAYVYRLLSFEKAHDAVDDEFKRPRDTKIYKLLPKFIKKIMKKLSKKVLYLTSNKKSKYIMEPSEILVMDSIIFDNNSLLKFEDGEFYAPKKATEFLEFFYGDYMKLPAEEDRVGHGDRIVDFENSYEKYTL